MILYLYSLIVVLMHFTKMSLVTAARLYIFSIGCFSLWLCSLYFKKLGNPIKHQYLALLVGTAFSFFFLPIDGFGEREHLMVMLGLPYILSTIVLTETGETGKTGLRILVGLMAGIGFLLKPLFLLAPLFIEIYLAIITRRAKNLIRIELLCILLLLIVYLASIYFLQPNYYKVILPFVARYYVGFNALDPHYFLFSFDTFIYLFTLAATLMVYKKLHQPHLFNVLLISAAAFFIVFVVPGETWRYHKIPFYTTITFLYILLLITYIHHFKAEKRQLTSADSFSRYLFPLPLCFIMVLLFTRGSPK